jgi:PAS domain S-box-containing protein
MHAYALIPLFSALGAAGLASAIAAREPGLRANRLVALILLSAAFWSLCEFLWNTLPDEALALRYARFSSFGALMLGPLGLHLMLTVLPELAGRLRGLLAASYAATLAAVATNVLTPWYADEMLNTPWGRTPALGPAVPVVFVAVAAPPLCAFGCWLWRRRAREASQRTGWAAAAPVAAFCVATLTEFILPLAEVPAPRLGSASIVVWGAVTFWAVYRVREPVIAPRRFAREILSILPAGVVLLRLDGRIRACNARFGELVGCAARELMGLPMKDLVEGTAAAAARSGGDRECDLRRADGGRIPVCVSHAPLRDRDGATIGAVLVVRDLREVTALRGRLITSGRLAAVGQLAAGITHEINNPIAYVRSNVALFERHWQSVGEALEKALASPPVAAALAEGSEMLRESREGIERVAAIVRDVGGFSQTGPAVRELEDVSRLLDTAVRVAAPQLRGRARIERCFSAVPLVACFPQELMQVFLNLVLNAAQALETQGTIRLVTETRDGDAIVRVEDDGRGMPPEIRERVFDPFFTTKPAGEGTGLGLAISRQIVIRHGGTIRVESQPGRGTAFEIRLPVPAGAAADPGDLV